MRPIKFRAWFENDKVMTGSFGIEETHNFLHSGAPYNLMQFTGLHDKNGKEIWEGDVVRAANADWDVRWIDRTAKFAFVFPPTNVSFDMDALLDAEVIGNIYSNPDLQQPMSREEWKNNGV